MNDDRRDNIGRYYGPPPDILPPPPVKSRRKLRRQPPQDTVNQFWDRLNSRFPGKVFTLLPNNPYARRKAQKTPHGTVSGQRAAKSYEEARAECQRDVDRIIRECRRLNQKYRDPHFDIEWDLKSGQRNCLDGLSISGDSMKPKGVKRVTDIFEKPEFYINGPTAGDVRQGRDGDCYLMAALCGLGNMKGLIDRISVQFDQNIGVYGFVFFRDGEWQHTIIDDKLYLRAPDYDEAQDERIVWDDINRVDAAEEYRKAHQTGSRALYFAQCSDENETWLPLLEKAYAKAHGDFASIDGGFTGEAIEDLTGGVTTEIYSTDILDRDAFWRDELMHVGEEFLFGCATGFYSNWLDTSGAPREREGISEGHAYSIMDAREVKGHRLLKLRNPWGRKEWTGKWSDGSSEWTAEWMELLDHKFGNDGIFWISYEDLLKKYQHFDRTRIFGPDWNVTQCWTNVNVSWAAEYHSTKFSLTLAEKAPVVIVLAQLDDTYFGGLEGGYGFDLHFRLEADNKEDEYDYIVRSNGNYAMARSVSTDIELEAGTYSVLMKITATRNSDKDHLEDVLPMYAATRREKVIQMGLSYDLANAKGVVVETAAERTERKAREKIRKAKDRERYKETMRSQALKHWKKGKERHTRDKQRQERKERSDAARRGTTSNGVRKGGPDRNGFIEERQSPENFDTLAMQKPDGARQENGGQEKQDESTEVLKIKSFSGEDIIINREKNQQPEEPSSATAQATHGPQVSAQDRSTAVADKVVESLEDVIKVADDETKANRADATPDKDGKTDEEGREISATEEEPVEDRPPTPIIQVNGVDTITDVHPLPNLPLLSQPEESLPPPSAGEAPDADTTRPDECPSPSFSPPARQTPPRSDTLDTTAAMVFGMGGADLGATDFNNHHNHNHNHDLGPFDNEAAEPASDAESFPSFDWNTDLDMPSDSDSSSGSSNASRRRGRFRRRMHTRGRRMPERGGGGPPGPDGILSPPRGVFIEVDNTQHTDDDGGPEEPWNAVCVVGLRVYSTLGGEGVKLRVVRPKNALLEHRRRGGGGRSGGGRSDESEAEAEAEADKQGLITMPNGGEAVHGGREFPLDPDDMARGAIAVTAESTAHVVVDDGGNDGTDGRAELKLGRRQGRAGRAGRRW